MMQFFSDKKRKETETGTRNRIRIDLHIHSDYSSDSTIPVADILRSWERTGILPLVCDHNTTAGSVHVYREIHSKDQGIPEILAEEILTTDGEIIGAFLLEEIPSHMSAEETLDEIRDQGAISIVPHPFCSFRSSVIHPDVLDRIIDRIDIIEGFNGRTADERDNSLARQYAVRHKKPVSAGSDAHRPDELGRTYVEMDPFSSPAELVSRIRSAEIHFRRSHVGPHAVNRTNPSAGIFQESVS
ncbi:MAG: PHP domain-containing protein [Methanoregula sp.]|jgi:hypothetical protein|nr:PHP domain-containing protein [Methanoregula sp.]